MRRINLLAIFPDRQLYVNLRGSTKARQDPDDVLLTLLQVLGVPDDDISSDFNGRQALYRSLLHGRRLLLLLDNASDTSQVRPLLPGGTRSSVIVTTREPLAALGPSYHLPVAELSTEDGIQLLGKLAGDDRVGTRSGAAVRVVELCGGLPLAVRIAGARLQKRRYWLVSTLVDRLTDERHRVAELRLEDLDVRASFLVSYADLSPGLSRAFRLLALTLTPGFTVDRREDREAHYRPDLSQMDPSGTRVEIAKRPI